jgi:hypothetical protein
MGLLQFSTNGNSFASGVLKYAYRPATPQDTTNRIIIPIEIGNGAQIEAVLDTGAPYPILDINIARLAGYTPESVLAASLALVLAIASAVNFDLL